jgi:uncharacterized protein
MPTRDKTATLTTQSPDDTPAQTLCPSCRELVDSTTPSVPFCSNRCRLADLGKWFNEDYVISRDIKDADLDQGE